MSTLFVSGALANKPGNGGEAWVRLSWILGLQRLGFDVHFVEQISATSCVDSNGDTVRIEDSTNLTYFRDVVGRFDLAACSSLLRDDGSVVFGPSVDELLALADAAVALVNISGHLRHAPLLQRLHPRIYVDVDPGYTQYWHADGTALGLDSHDYLVTVGANIGTAGCPIPTGGRQWHPVRQPVVLEHWPVRPVDYADRFTTVGSWRGPYGPVTVAGRAFGLKVHEFRRFLELPGRAVGEFRIALDIHPADGADRVLLERHGWRLDDPRRVAATPEDFRDYVEHSSAEFSVAQGIYVDTNSGWFSDRTVRYLAAGKPAIVQDTGLAGTLPVGEGLLAFTTMEQAEGCVRHVVESYDQQSRAARSLAETVFDSDVVLARLLADIGMPT